MEVKYDIKIHMGRQEMKNKRIHWKFQNWIQIEIGKKMRDELRCVQLGLKKNMGLKNVRFRSASATFPSGSRMEKCFYNTNYTSHDFNNVSKYMYRY